MKLLKPLFALMLIVTLVSCSSDDDGIDPLLDSDNDGVVDVDDLCPNTPGTIIDQGCYLFTNINISSSPYEVTFLQSTLVQTTNVNGFEVITTTTNFGDTFQLNYTFSEIGTFIVNGLYRNVFTVVVNGELQNEDSEIIDKDNVGGEYSTNDSPRILVLDGDTYEVTLFNENELRITLEDNWIEDGDTFVSTKEIRLERQ